MVWLFLDLVRIGRLIGNWVLSILLPIELALDANHDRWLIRIYS